MLSIVRANFTKGEHVQLDLEPPIKSLCEYEEYLEYKNCEPSFAEFHLSRSIRSSVNDSRWKKSTVCGHSHG